MSARARVRTTHSSCGNSHSNLQRRGTLARPPSGHSTNAADIVDLLDILLGEGTVTESIGGRLLALVCKADANHLHGGMSGRNSGTHARDILV